MTQAADGWQQPSSLPAEPEPLMPVFPAVCQRSHTAIPFKAAIKITFFLKTDFPDNFLDGEISFFEHLACMLKPDFQKLILKGAFY